jgi:hypothetical protein
MAEDSGEDLYSDQGAPPAAAPAENADQAPDEGAQTALLPKSFFPDEPRPGKVCRVRVEQVMDDQVAVSYEKSEEGGETAGAPMPRDEEMAGYMS